MGKVAVRYVAARAQTVLEYEVAGTSCVEQRLTADEEMKKTKFWQEGGEERQFRARRYQAER